MVCSWSQRLYHFKALDPAQWLANLYGCERELPPSKPNLSVPHLVHYSRQNLDNLQSQSRRILHYSPQYRASHHYNSNYCRPACASPFCIRSRSCASASSLHSSERATSTHASTSRTCLCGTHATYRYPLQSG